MTIVVSPLSRVFDQIKAHKPARIVSLLDPHTPFPRTNYYERHLQLTMHDIVGDADGWVAPTTAHLEDLIGFVEPWDRKAPILIHCFAGISRSTAAAFITACVHNPRTDEREIAQALYAGSANARPNKKMITLADAMLGRNGRLISAIEEAGRVQPWNELHENEPFFFRSIYKDGA